MMTKTTSKFSGFIKKAGIIPLMTLMIYFLCTDLVAQKTIIKTQSKEKVKKSDFNYSLDTIKRKKHKNKDVLLDAKLEKKSEAGYIYLEDNVYFVIKENDKKEYYTRTGILILDKELIAKLDKIEITKDPKKLPIKNFEYESENIKIKSAILDETEKANILKVDKLSDFDTKDKKEGYIYMNNGTYYFIKNDKGEIEYFNRWGNRVNEKGEKLDETNEKK